MELGLTRERIGIGLRLAIMVFGLLIVALGIFAALSYIVQRRQAMDLFVENSSNMARAGERNLRFCMLANCREEIGAAIEQIGEDELVKAIMVMSHGGQPAFGNDRGSVRIASVDDIGCSGCHGHADGRVLEQLPATADISLLKDHKLGRVSLPIYNAPDCSNHECHVHSSDESILGVMQLDLSYDQIDKSLARSHLRLIALSILMALVVFVIVLTLIRKWVTNPARELLEATKRVADGELGHSIPVAEAEFGALSEAFNKIQEDLLFSRTQLVTAAKLASIGNVAGLAVHNLNNRLTGVLTFAEDLADEADPNDPHLARYRAIKQEAIRCRESVKELLDLSCLFQKH